MPENLKNKDIRISPSIIEAEAAVLGCILINPDAMAKSMEFLNEKDFYNRSNAIIYENMLVLFEDNNTIDYISVIEQLKKTKKLKEVGDAYYITGLTEQAPSTQNVEYYAKSTLFGLLIQHSVGKVALKQENLGLRKLSFSNFIDINK